MSQDKERTALNPSVAAEVEQSLTNHNASIADGAANVNPQPVSDRVKLFWGIRQQSGRHRRTCG